LILNQISYKNASSQNTYYQTFVYFKTILVNVIDTSLDASQRHVILVTHKNASYRHKLLNFCDEDTLKKQSKTSINIFLIKERKKLEYVAVAVDLLGNYKTDMQHLLAYTKAPPKY